MKCVTSKSWPLFIMACLSILAAVSMFNGCGLSEYDAGSDFEEIAIDQANAKIATNGKLKLTATGYTPGGDQDCSSLVSWSSSDESVATINGGILLAVSAGTTTIKASLEDLNAEAPLTVAVMALQSVSVSPATASIGAGENQQFAAKGSYKEGTTPVNDVDVTLMAEWKTSDAAIATVDAAGLSSGVAAGSATITATVDSKSGTAALTVTAAPAPPADPGDGGEKTITTIEMYPTSATVTVGTTKQLKLNATYSDGSKADIAASTEVTWTSSDTAVATVDNKGKVAAKKAGTCTVTASHTNGMTATCAITGKAASTPPPTRY